MRLPERYMVLWFGDFNTRVGNDVNTMHDPFSTLRMKLEWFEVPGFWALNESTITNKAFQYRRFPQHTWFNPAESRHIGHVLDLVLVTKRLV